MNLSDCRQEIEDIDLQILKLLNQRLSICSKIGEIKKINNTPILNIKREEELINKLKSYNLIEPTYIELIWNNIMLISRTVQNNIINK